MEQLQRELRQGEKTRDKLAQLKEQLRAEQADKQKLATDLLFAQYDLQTTKAELEKEKQVRGRGGCSPMSLWLPCGLHGLAVPNTVTVTVNVNQVLSPVSTGVYLEPEGIPRVFIPSIFFREMM